VKTIRSRSATLHGRRADRNQSKAIPSASSPWCARQQSALESRPIRWITLTVAEDG